MINVQDILVSSIIDAVSGLIKNIFYIILFVWGVKTVVKKMPE